MNDAVTDRSDRPGCRTLATGRFLRLVRDGGWEYAERTGASGVVAVLAVTTADELLLTEQYRPPVRRRVIDLPAGLSGDIPGEEEESLSIAARRELEEETGFTAQSLRHLARLPSSAGLTSETIDLFVADGLSQIGDGGGDEYEQITVHVVPRAGIADWLAVRAAAEVLIDPKVYAALWWADQLEV